MFPNFFSYHHTIYTGILFPLVVFLITGSDSVISKPATHPHLPDVGRAIQFEGEKP